MGSRGKRNQIRVEWTIGELTIDGGGELTAPRAEFAMSSTSTIRVTRQQHGADRQQHPADNHLWDSFRYSPQESASNPSIAHQSRYHGELHLIWDLVRWLVIATMGIAMVSGASPSPQVTVRAAVTVAVERSLISEDMAWRTSSEDSFARLLDNEAPTKWYRSWRKNWQIGQMHTGSHPAIADSQIQSIYLHEGIAVAQVQVDRPPDNPWQLSPFIETRFYRSPEESYNPARELAVLSSNPWLRTAPHPTFWGEERWLETKHLRFDYYAHDAEIVEAAAPILELIYVDLFRTLGGPIPPTTPKLNLVLIQSLDPKWEAPGHAIEMVSPTLMERPLMLTPTEAFIDTVFTRLSFRVLSQAIPDTRRYWDSVGIGIRTWLRTQVTEIPSPWHEQTDELFYETLRVNQPLSALDIDDGRRVNLPMNDTLIWQYRVAQSMIDYSIETQGPGALPRLLDGFVRYRRWSDLIPYVYGIPAQEWEAGWNNYLRRNLKLHHEASSATRADPPQLTRP